MAEAGDVGTDVARVDQEEEIQSATEMDLDTARVVLQAIVDTHEDTITEQASLDRIGGYTTEQVRQAEKVVAQSILKEHGSKFAGQIPGSPPDSSTRKETPQGSLSLALSDAFVTCTLQEKESSHILLRNQFLLREPDDTYRLYEKGITGFRDNRSGDRTEIDDLENNFTLEGFRRMVRGTRWMSTNMLHWNDPNTIMPEQLDNRGLSPAPQNELSKPE